MKKKHAPKGSRSPSIRLVGLEVAVAATGIAGSMIAAAAPGDLDPAFGDVGRRSDLGLPNTYYDSGLWSVDGAEDDSVLFGGGGEYCYWGCYTNFFLGRLGPDGSTDGSFLPPRLSDTTVIFDTVRQPDGKLLAVGRQGPETTDLMLARLLADGSLDPEFGEGGVTLIAHTTTGGYIGYAVSVDAAGRITVAGTRGADLMVARFLPNGTPDAAFGTGGVYVADTVRVGYRSAMRVAMTESGGYRVLANTGNGSDAYACTVTGLTASGAIDPAFGSGGQAGITATGGDSLTCHSMALLDDGRAIVVGETAEGRGQAVRLLANGARDGTFDADAALQPFGAATAIALGTSGKLFIAATSVGEVPGANVLRLLADGSLDSSYGTAGHTIIDIRAPRAQYSRISELQALSADRLLVAGNSISQSQSFIARLLGSGAGGGPGVLGVKTMRPLATEQQGRAVVVVRRTGGSSGTVAVSYGTAASSGLVNATSGLDFTETRGRLEWADGDASDREIVVPIVTDADLESPEFFAITLDSPEGGAGLGASGADVELAGTGYPAGHFKLEALQAVALEGRAAQFSVSRRYYSQGTVSVTLRVAATATATAGQDFAAPGQTSAWQDVVLTWADGESANKIVSVSALIDKVDDADETIELELVSPTGGAVIDGSSKAAVTILNNSTVSSGGGSKGGGGQFGAVGLFLLGWAGALRRRLLRSQHGVTRQA